MNPGACRVRPVLLLVLAAVLPSCGGGGGGSFATATLLSLEIAPTLPNVGVGMTLPLTATGVFDDDATSDLTATVVWTSSNDAVATVTGGTATGISPGSVTVTAARGGLSVSTTLVVLTLTLLSIEISPAGPPLAAGTTRALKATGLLSGGLTQDLTALATWDSTNELVATVGDAAGAKGLATGVSAGSVTVSATVGLVSGAVSLDVSAAVLVSLLVTPDAPTFAAGTTLRFTATGTFSDASVQDLTEQATWSDNGAALTLSDAAGSKGLASGSAPGMVTVTAAVGPIADSTAATVSGATLVSLAVAPDAPVTGPGYTLRFVATGTFSDASIQDLTQQAIWSSSAPGTATLSNAAGGRGVATGVAAGAALVTARFGVVSDTTTLTVSAAALVSISVTPATPSAGAGEVLLFTATGTLTDASVLDLTEVVIWSSSDSATATISNAAGTKGRALTLAPGMTTIEASWAGVTDSTTLTVP